MTVVLDSSFLSDIRRGHAGAVDLLERLARDGEGALVPTGVVAEYLAGSRDPGTDLATLDRAAILDDFRVSRPYTPFVGRSPGPWTEFVPSRNELLDPRLLKIAWF